MAWARRWRIEHPEKWRAVLRALLTFEVDFSRHPVELIAREELREKSDAQRALFHAVCDDVGTRLGYFPGEFKREVKRLYFGEDWRHFSTEDLDHEHYGDLIECAYMIAAEMDVVVPDRRRR